MKNKKKESQINYLDLVPERSSQLRWHEDIRGKMVLEVENKGAFNTIAQKLFHRPRYTKIHLDENGTFIWPLTVGKKSVADIAALVKDAVRRESRATLSEDCQVFPDNGELSFCIFYQ